MSDQDRNNREQQGGKPLPKGLATYVKVKSALKGPDLMRDEDGMAAKRFTKTYLRSTCPFCETTAEHEGNKYRYSKVTKKKIITNIAIMLAVAFATGIGLLNIFIGGAVILLIGFSTSQHTERKMFYTLNCRNCGSHFPIDIDEQNKIRADEAAKKKAEAGQVDDPDAEEPEPAAGETSESAVGSDTEAEGK